MKKVLFLFLMSFITVTATFGQECSFNATNGNYSVCTQCTCADGIDSLAMSVSNNADVISFDGVFTIERGVSIDLTGTQQTFLVPAGDTVTINGDLLFTGSGSPKEFKVDGVLIINGTLDLENQQFEINGSGTIEAERIIGADQSTCTGDGDCPTITADTCDDGTGDFCETALPIELKSFSASKLDDKINLDWTTAKEENFSHFEVERTLDQNKFKVIGIVQGQGESYSDVAYAFTDESAPFGVIYYRLKAVDIDDTFEYSWIASVKNGFDGQMSVYPNPVQDVSSIRIQVPTQFKENLSYMGLYDLQGGVVEEFLEFDTNQQLKINQKLKAGMYLLKVQHNGLEENIRIIIK